LYEYDSLNRLEKVTEPNGKITSYSFDKAGNRKTETVKVGQQSIPTTYTYNEQNRLMSTQTWLSDTESETTTYVYDNNGNLKTKTKITMTNNAPIDVQKLPSFELEIVKDTDQGSGAQDLTIYSYDNFNRLISLKEGSTTSTYKYNAEDYRVEKTTGESTTLYLYEVDKVILETDSTGTQKALNVYGTNLLYRSLGNEEYYYLYNAHGDVTALISPSGEVKGTYDYDAFGNIISQTGEVNNNITFAGYQYDEETDLYYLNARYYDSKIARFITEDSYRGSASDPLSLNLYTYCHNEPIMYTDPTGHWEESDKFILTDTQVGKSAYRTITESTKEWNRLNNLLAKVKDKNSYEAKQLKAYMDKMHKTAEDARLNYALVSQNKKYFNAKYGENSCIVDVRKFTNNVDSYKNLNEVGIYAKDYLAGVGIAITINEMQAASRQVGDFKYIFVGYDDAYYGGMDDFLELLESKYVIPNLKNVEAYHEGKKFGNVSSVASGVIRLGKGGIITIGSVVIGTKGVVLTSSGAGAAIGVPEIAIAVSGVAYGAATMHNGSNLVQVSWDKVVNGDNKGAGSSNIPDKARDIANQVKSKNGAPPQGYKGGRTFNNQPVNGGQKLPDGVNYKEYDVNPYVKGQNRGTERVVIGDDGSVWYTNDHYHTFTRIE